METNKTELNMNELKTANADYAELVGEKTEVAAAIFSGAVSGSGIGSGYPRPGGAIAAVICGAMGAAASFVNLFLGD